MESKSSGFTFSEAFNNNIGQTSIALICASMMCFCSCLFMGYIIFTDKEQFAIHVLSFAALGSGIFGYRAYKDIKEKSNPPK